MELDKIYGKFGDDMLEYHCTKKFSIDNSSSSDVCIGDYIQVCPACHKLLDRYYSLIEYDDLKNIIRSK
jgi:predicted HNH restriction endonuclease